MKALGNLEIQSLGTSRLACNGKRQAFIDGEGGSWDPYYCGIGPIMKEGSMKGGKQLPFHRTPVAKPPTQDRKWFLSWLKHNFHNIYLKNTP